MKKPNPVAFDFVLEHLHSLDPIVKPMFGCHAVYVENKIVLIVRKRETNKDANGVWIATSRNYHQSLKMDFPSLHSIPLLGSESNWQMIHEDADDFEESVIRACDLILKRDERIGRVPKQKSKRKK